jgi:hypothetical protein
MSWLNFIAEMTKALAWPAAVAVILILFHEPLRKLIGRLRSFKYGESEISFEEKAAEVTKDVALAQIGRPKVATTILKSEASEIDIEQRDDDLLILAEQSPGPAILETWLRVERKTRKLASRNSSQDDKRPLGPLLKLLEEKGTLSASSTQSIRGLWVLRNLAVHSADPVTQQKALEFVTLAQAILHILSAADAE